MTDKTSVFTEAQKLKLVNLEALEAFKTNYDVEISDAIIQSRTDLVKTNDPRLTDARTPVAHSHTKADVTDFAHTHTKTEITDFEHTHTKSQITDFAHDHTVSEITDFPTHLPANGGNADTVDNKHASDFATADHDHDATYLKLAGGNITGNLTIGGNLTVTGASTTIESTTLSVSDKLIEVARGNSTPLTSPAGLVVPKYDGTNTGALVFGADGMGKVGKVTLDGNGNISDVSNLQTLATRDLSDSDDGKVVIWDKAKKTLVSSGVAPYAHPTYTEHTSGFYKVAVDVEGHVSTVAAVTKEDITDLGVPAQDTVYTHPTFTAATNGLYKITVNNEGHVSATAAVSHNDLISVLDCATAADIGLLFN